MFVFRFREEKSEVVGKINTWLNWTLKISLTHRCVLLSCCRSEGLIVKVQPLCVCVCVCVGTTTGTHHLRNV